MAHAAPEPQEPDAGSALDPGTTADLLVRVRGGDDGARERLVARFLPLLRRWAHGRLPGYARGLADTDDIVQGTLIRALNQVGAFEPRHEGAFLAYLRRALINSIRDEIRRSMRRGEHVELDEEVPDPTPSVVEQAIGREALEAYEAALAELPEDQREAVLMRLEFGYSYQAIAEAQDRPSANAARMTVVRALLRVGESMGGRTIGS